MATTISTSVVLPDRDMLLMLRPAHIPLWDLPTSAVHAGESVQHAAQRVVREATGVSVTLTNLVGVYQDSAAATVRVVFTAYTTPERVRAPEGCEIAWLPLREAAALPDEQLAQPAQLRHILADVQRGIRFPLAIFVEE